MQLLEESFLLTTLGAIVAAIVAAIVGAIVSHGISILRENRRNKRETNIFGRWISSYQGATEDGVEKVWNIDSVDIDRRRGKIRIKSRNGSSDPTVATVSLTPERQLVGTWRTSRTEGLSVRGALLLTISPGGGYIYGYYAGMRSNGGTDYGMWALSRTEEGLDKAKRLLREASTGMFPLADQ